MIDVVYYPDINEYNGVKTLQIVIKNYQLEKSADDFKELIKVYSELNFDADYSELNSEEQLICKKMSFSVDSARKSLERLLDVELDNNKFSIIDKQDHLFEGEDESYDYFMYDILYLSNIL